MKVGLKMSMVLGYIYFFYFLQFKIVKGIYCFHVKKLNLIGGDDERMDPINEILVEASPERVVSCDIVEWQKNKEMGTKHGRRVLDVRL